MARRGKPRQGHGEERGSAGKSRAWNIPRLGQARHEHGEEPGRATRSPAGRGWSEARNLGLTFLA
jgi:hypothetical protein